MGDSWCSFNFLIFVKNVLFRAIILVLHMLERQSRVQETGMIVWFPQMFEQKEAHWIGAQCQVNMVKDAKMPLCWRHQQKTPNQNQMIYKLFKRNWKTCRSRKWCEQISSCSGWRLMAKKVPASAVAGAGVKWMHKARCSSASEFSHRDPWICRECLWYMYHTWYFSSWLLL